MALIHGFEMHAVTLVLILGLAENGAALKQTLNHGARGSTTARNTTTSTPGIVIYPDALNPLPVPKVLVDGSPFSMYYRVPLDMPANQGLRVNSTHVTIPHKASVQAFFIRNITVSESPGWYADYGVANQKYGFNPMSMFPYSNYGAAEKLISFGREGASINLQQIQRAGKQHGREGSSINLQQIQRAGEQHGQNPPPANVTFQRNLLANIFFLSSQSGSSYVKSTIDPVQLQMLDGAIANGDGSIGPDLVNMAEYLKSIKNSFKNVKESHPSSNNCHHFANGIVTDEGLVMPLGKPWLSYKGLTTFAKGVNFWLSTGTTVIEYDRLSNSLEIYYYAASLFNLVEEYDDQALAAVYYQGPPHTEKDNRVQDIGPSTGAHAIYQQYHMIPPNYQQWWRADTCNEAQKNEIGTMLENTNWRKLMTDLSQAEFVQIVTKATLALDCGHEYMRSWLPNSHGYGRAEAAVWIHLIFEVPSDAIDEVATKTNWNSIDIVQFNSQ